MRFIDRLNESLKSREVAYKLFNGVDFPDGAPYAINKVPGYAWTWHPYYYDDWQEFIHRAVISGEENQFGCSITIYQFNVPDGMLPKEPEGVINPRTQNSTWHADAGYFYDHNTNVKPGWHESDKVCVVTVPVKMKLYACMELDFRQCRFHDKLKLTKKYLDSHTRSPYHDV